MIRVPLALSLLALTCALSPAQQPPPAPPADAKPADSSAPPSPPTRGPTSPQYRLDDQGRWVPVAVPAPGSDEAVIVEARKNLAEDRPDAARVILDKWILANDRTGNPNLPAAYLARADAISAAGNEYAALYDYEMVIKSFMGAPEYIIAVERELEIGVRYLAGLKRKFLGIRIMGAAEEGQELLIRVQERMPGSRLGERACIELADYYYRERELTLAATAYDLFVQNYPNSPYKMRAMERRINANIARFKGPRYDGSPLIDARSLIRRFRTMYPAEAERNGVDGQLVRIDESAAEQKEHIAQWYLKRDDPVAARYTYNRLIREHPQTAAAGRSIDYMMRRGWLTPKEAEKDKAAPQAAAKTPDEPVKRQPGLDILP